MTEGVSCKMGPGVGGEDQLLVVTIFPTSGQPRLPEFSGFTPPSSADLLAYLFVSGVKRSFSKRSSLQEIKRKQLGVNGSSGNGK